MAVKKYDGLDSNYLLGDGSIPVAIPDTGIELTVASGAVNQTIDLSGYSKLAVVYEHDSTITVDYLELLGKQDTSAVISIVADLLASSGYALKIEGATTLIFGTRMSYVPNVLKRITVKAMKETGTTDSLYASVMAYKNGVFNSSTDGSAELVYNKVALDGSETISDSAYTTFYGYIKEVADGYTGYRTPSTANPSTNPNYPSPLPDDTDEISLLLVYVYSLPMLTQN